MPLLRATRHNSPLNAVRSYSCLFTNELQLTSGILLGFSHGRLSQQARRMKPEDTAKWDLSLSLSQSGVESIRFHNGHVLHYVGMYYFRSLTCIIFGLPPGFRLTMNGGPKESMDLLECLECANQQKKKIGFQRQNNCGLTCVEVGKSPRNEDLGRGQRPCSYLHLSTK